MSAYFVYVLQCRDESLYTGITTDVSRRFETHKRGAGGNYTRSRGVVKMLYAEKQKNRSCAQKREAEIKSWTRQKKIQLIHSKDDARFGSR